MLPGHRSHILSFGVFGKGVQDVGTSKPSGLWKQVELIASCQVVYATSADGIEQPRSKQFKSLAR